MAVSTSSKASIYLFVLLSTAWLEEVDTWMNNSYNSQVTCNLRVEYSQAAGNPWVHATCGSTHHPQVLDPRVWVIRENRLARIWVAVF